MHINTETWRWLIGFGMMNSEHNVQASRMERWSNFRGLRLIFLAHQLAITKTRCTRKTREEKAKQLKMNKISSNNFNLTRISLRLPHFAFGLWICHQASRASGFIKLGFLWRASTSSKQTSWRLEHIFFIDRSADVSIRLQNKAQFINRFCFF